MTTMIPTFHLAAIWARDYMLFLVTNSSPHVSVYPVDTMTYAVQLYSKSSAREAAILVQGVL